MMPCRRRLPCARAACQQDAVASTLADALELRCPCFWKFSVGEELRVPPLYHRNGSAHTARGGTWAASVAARTCQPLRAAAAAGAAAVAAGEQGAVAAAAAAGDEHGPLLGGGLSLTCAISLPVALLRISTVMFAVVRPTCGAQYDTVCTQ